MLNQLTKSCDKIWNFIFKNNKILKYCRICNRPIFNVNTSWGMRGLCVYCGDAYKEGKDTGIETPSTNDYGHTWYSSDELMNALTLEMMREGYTQSYDEIFKLYRIIKR